MSVWSRGPLGLSLALHAGLVALGWRRHFAVERELPNGFWAGQTFEAPELVEDAPSPDNEPSWSEGARGPSESGHAETKVEPKSAAAPRPKSLTARANAGKNAGQESTSPPSSGGPSQENSGFGAEVAAPGVRDLVSSFARAIPAAASGDPDWATVPIGPAGNADVTLVLDTEAKPHAEGIEGHVPAPLRRLILKTILTMAGGRFAATGDGPAMERLRIAASVTQLAVPPEAQGQTGGVFALGFEPPDSRRVSRASFTLASGRHIEITVRGSSAK
jgi:hypothetical protein